MNFFFHFVKPSFEKHHLPHPRQPRSLRGKWGGCGHNPHTCWGNIPNPLTSDFQSDYASSKLFMEIAPMITGIDMGTAMDSDALMLNVSVLLSLFLSDDHQCQVSCQCHTLQPDKSACLSLPVYILHKQLSF